MLNTPIALTAEGVAKWIVRFTWRWLMSGCSLNSNEKLGSGDATLRPVSENDRDPMERVPVYFPELCAEKAT